MEDTYEDPYADRPKPTAPDTTNTEDDGIMEDTYEDPYADGKRKVPPHSMKQSTNDTTEENYEGIVVTPLQISLELVD